MKTLISFNIIFRGAYWKWFIFLPCYAILNIALFNSPVDICIIVFTTSRQWCWGSFPEMNKFLIGKSWRS